MTMYLCDTTFVSVPNKWGYIKFIAWFGDNQIATFELAQN